MPKKPRIPHKFLPWIDARKKYRLTDAEIQMARELGLSPKRFGRYSDRKNEPWKKPLREFIADQYEKQFGKRCPDEVKTMEQIAAEHVAKRAARKAERADRQAAVQEQAPDESKQTLNELEPPPVVSEQVPVESDQGKTEPS